MEHDRSFLPKKPRDRLIVTFTVIQDALSDLVTRGAQNRRVIDVEMLGRSQQRRRRRNWIESGYGGNVYSHPRMRHYSVGAGPRPTGTGTRICTSCSPVHSCLQSRSARSLRPWHTDYLDG